MDSVLLYGLFGMALVFTLLCGFGKRALWFPLSSLLTIGGILTCLALGHSLEELLLPLLLLTAAGLLPLLRKEDGDEL